MPESPDKEAAKKRMAKDELRLNDRAEEARMLQALDEAEAAAEEAEESLATDQALVDEMEDGPAKAAAQKQIEIERQAALDRAKEAREAAEAESAKETADREEEAVLAEREDVEAMVEGEEKEAAMARLQAHQHKADDHIKEASRKEAILKADTAADLEEEAVEKRRIEIDAMQEGAEKEDALAELLVSTTDAFDRREEEKRLEEIALKEIEIDREEEAVEDNEVDFIQAKSGMTEEEKAQHEAELSAAHAKAEDHQRELATLEGTAELEKERNKEKEKLAHRKLAISKMKNNQAKKEALREQHAMETKLADLEKEMERHQEAAAAEVESNRLNEEVEAERLKLQNMADNEEKDELRKQLEAHQQATEYPSLPLSCLITLPSPAHVQAAADHAKELEMVRELAKQEVRHCNPNPRIQMEYALS